MDILSRAKVTQRSNVGTTFWNISASTPDANHRQYPWLNLNNGLVYVWSNIYGFWISPRPFAVGQIWAAPAGTPESAVWSLDGGDGSNPSITAPTPVTGAMWQVISSLAAKFPVGVGAFDSGKVLGIADTGGAENVSLTADQNGPHSHGPPANSDNFWAHASPAGTGQYNVFGSGVDTILGAQTASSGKGDAHTNIPPYYVVFFITPTARQFYAIPG